MSYQRVTEATDPTPKFLTSDRLQALLQMQKTDPLCKYISKCLSNGKAPQPCCILVWVIINWYFTSGSVLANPWDLLSYIRTVSAYNGLCWCCHYRNTPTSYQLQILKQMLPHIEETLLSTIHLPVSSEDTLHFYRYLCTHVLIANRQFLV